MHLLPSEVTAFALLLVAAIPQTDTSSLPQTEQLPRVKGPSGLRLLVDQDNTAPTLRVVLPGWPESDRSIVIPFPEHVTAVRHGDREGQHLYRWEPGTGGNRPAWRHEGQSLVYERDLPGRVHFLARATLDSDGVRFRYEFHNRLTTSYDIVYAVTDPRLTALFHDVRLERTYVHYATGLELLAAETPARLTLPLQQWLPVRYLASFAWPVPNQRVERREDGITYYNTTRPIDAPFIATVSSDTSWVVASFARTAGNVWSNPELTCQHVDPQTMLAPGAIAATEMKILVLRAPLRSAFEHMLQQRNSLH